MRTNRILIEHVADGKNFRHFSSEDGLSPDYYGANFYVTGVDEETEEHVKFFVPKTELAAMRNREHLQEGSLVRFSATEIPVPHMDTTQQPRAPYTDYDLFKITEIEDSNDLDIHMHLDEFPKILPGGDPIDHVYQVKGRLIGGADAGEEFSVNVTKTTFVHHVMPVRSAGSFNPMKVLQTEDAKVFFDHGDAVTLPNCWQNDDDVYTCDGRLRGMRLNAEVTILSPGLFSYDHRFQKGRTQLTVMFNNTHLIGRTAKISHHSGENPNFQIGGKLRLVQAYKMGISPNGESICIIPKSIEKIEHTPPQPP